MTTNSRGQRLILPSKMVGEVITAVFDFRDVIFPDVTISSVTVTCTVFSGTDSEPSNVVLGDARIIDGQIVKQWLAGGVAGVCYTIACSVVTSGADTFEKLALLAVTPTAGGETHPDHWPLALTLTGAAPDTFVGDPNFSYLYTATGGVGDLTSSLEAGEYPPGTSMPSNSFILSGVPTLAGSFTGLTQAEDEYGQTAQNWDTIFVAESENPWEEEVLADGPWYYYKLDEATALTGDTIIDYSGNARDGMLTSVQTGVSGLATGLTAEEAGLIGASIFSFDCTGDATQMTTIQPYIVNSDGLPADNPFKFTVVAVVNTTSHTGRATLIVSSDFGASSGVRHFQTALLDGCPYLVLITGSNTTELLLSTTDIADGTDHVLHFVYDGTLGPADTDKMRIYIDGDLDCSKATAFVPDSPAGYSPNAIDRGSLLDYFGFIGRIDEVIYYITALTAERIQIQYNSRNTV